MSYKAQPVAEFVRYMQPGDARFYDQHTLSRIRWARAVAAGEPAGIEAPSLASEVRRLSAIDPGSPEYQRQDDAARAEAAWPFRSEANRRLVLPKRPAHFLRDGDLCQTGGAMYVMVCRLAEAYRDGDPDAKAIVEASEVPPEQILHFASHPASWAAEARKPAA